MIISRLITGFLAVLSVIFAVLAVIAFFTPQPPRIITIEPATYRVNFDSGEPAEDYYLPGQEGEKIVTCKERKNINEIWEQALRAPLEDPLEYLPTVQLLRNTRNKKGISVCGSGFYLYSDRADIWIRRVSQFPHASVFFLFRANFEGEDGYGISKAPVKVIHRNFLEKLTAYAYFWTDFK